MPKMLFDDTRALRREQREARIERKRERREARQLKRRQHPTGIETITLEELRTMSRRAPADRPEPESESEPAVTAAPIIVPNVPTVPLAAASGRAPQMPAPRPAAQSEPAAPPSVEVSATRGAPSGASPARSADARRVARRERDVAAFLERREERLNLAREEARERIARLGEEEAVNDALGALAHSQASPWRRHREQLAEAIAGRRIPEVGAAARRASRGAAADAARTSQRAPDADTALAVAVAYAVIADAPWAAIRGPRAERNATPPRRLERPFRR